ncbi:MULTISPECIES: hypothetical protein [unclassified Streptomyces]|uniref:hypothetical protein n=1 Tax=unclassified Streptomyces TaxID=2593676 RepID=UPI0021086897|nr:MULTISPECIES: hypothetical protein [unclassified Streptomyces]
MLRRVRLLLVITAALPLFGTATAYAAALAQTTGTAPAHGRPDDSDRDGAYGPGRGGLDHPGHPQPDGAGHGLPARGSPAAGPWAPATPSGPDSSSAPDAAPVSRFSPSSRAAEPSRAGSRAGEGRMRPGRPDGPAAEVEGDDTVPSRAAETADQPEEPETADVPGVTPGASPPPEEAGLQPAQPPQQPAGRQAASEGEGTTEPVLQILPLGSGLVLIGLGLGLALLGLRLRRP